MKTLVDFNQMSAADAKKLIEPCVAISTWSEGLVAVRPYATLAALYQQAEKIALSWQEDDLDLALAAHPRIGDRIQGDASHQRLSRQEQGGVDSADIALQQRLLQANQAYEARFDRIFIIRAAGRSGEEILSELQRRLTLSSSDEKREALQQLREITLLRLEGCINL